MSVLWVSISTKPHAIFYRYRATSNVKLPLRIIPTVTEIGTTQVSYAVTIKTNFNVKLSATNVVLRIPTPLNTTSVDCQVANGKAKYVPGENVMIWKYVIAQGIKAALTNSDHPLHQAAENPGRTGMYTIRNSRLDQHDTSTSLGKTAHRRRFSSSHVHSVGPDCAVPEGV